MRYLLSAGISVCLIILLLSCENQASKEERLAKRYCSTCHSFPDPSLIDKNTWEKSVLPEMGFRMGMDYSQLGTIPSNDLPFVRQALPTEPMMSVEEWELIRNYFVSHAPDSLARPEIPEEFPLKQFDVSALRLPGGLSPSVMMIKADTLTKSLYVCLRQALLYKFDFNLNLKDSFQLGSPSSTMLFSEKENPIVATMGIMDPNDQPLGSLNVLDEKKRELKPVIDSLTRPVFIQAADFNKDKLEDYVICAFGNY